MTRSNWKNLFGWTLWEYPPNNAAGTGNNVSDSERFVMSPDSRERSPCTSAYQLSAHHANKVALRVWEREYEKAQEEESGWESEVYDWLQEAGGWLAGWLFALLMSSSFIWSKEFLQRERHRNPVGEERGRKEWGAKEGKRGRERQMRDSQRRQTRRGGIMRRSCWKEKMETTLCHLKPLIDKESPNKYFQINLQAAHKGHACVFHSHDELKSQFSKSCVLERGQSLQIPALQMISERVGCLVRTKTEYTLCLLAYLARCGHGEKQRTR